MNEKQTSRLLSGALLLTIAGIISKVLSALYRVPLQNLTGDIGFYVYQQIYPFLATITTMALYGFPMAVSKLASERMLEERTITYRNFFIPVLFILFLINSLFAMLVYLFAPFVAKLVQDVYITRTLQIAVIVLFFVPFVSFFRGVLQANLEMKPTAYSQLIEQVIRVSIIVIAAYLVYRQTLTVQAIGNAAVVATAVGLFSAMLLLAIYFTFRFPIRQYWQNDAEEKIPWRKYVHTIIFFGFIATMNHLTLILVQIADVLTLVPQLIQAGYTSLESMELKGLFDRSIPLVQFGVVFGSALAVAFVPTVVRKQVLENIADIKSSIAVSFYIAAGATFGLIVLLREVNTLLYLNDDGTRVMQLMTMSILLLTLSIMSNAILQASGYIKRTVALLLFMFMLKILFNYLFIPLLGIYGNALATISSLFILTIITLFEVKRLLQIQFFQLIKWKAFFLALMGMVVYLLLVKYMFTAVIFTRLHLFIYVMFLVISGAIIYIVILLRFDALNEREISRMPLSDYILFIRKKVKKIH